MFALLVYNTQIWMLRYGGLDLTLRKLITDGLSVIDQFRLLALDDRRAFAVCKRSVAVSILLLTISMHFNRVVVLCCCLMSKILEIRLHLVLGLVFSLALGLALGLGFH